MMYDADLLVLMVLMMFCIIIIAALNVSSDMAGTGVLLIIIGMLFGWPFAALGVLLLIAHYHHKRNSQ